jgi:2'-5' RNA ligase
MQPNIVLLPNKQFIQNVLKLRRQVVDMKLSKADPRENVLPHTTILYFEETLTKQQISMMVQHLDCLHINQQITLDIIKVTSWKNKVVAMFDTSPLSSLISDVEKLIGKTKVRFNTDYKKIYGDSIGDHMKLARKINPNSTEEVVKLFKNYLPMKITFERIAFIGYETMEKDILWEKKLSI